MTTIKFLNFDNGTHMENILNQINNKRNGAYFKLQYRTDCSSKVSAMFKGNSVTKITTMSVRKGVNYNNLKSVKIKRNQPDYTPSTRKPWYHKVDGQNVLLKHNSKEQYYVALYPNMFGKTTSQYFLNNKPISTEELKAKGIMQPSFWTAKDTKPEMMTVGLDNIIKIF